MKKEERIKKGNVDYSSKLEVNKDLIAVLRTLQETDIAKREYSLYRMKLEDALYNGRVFMNYHFRMHEVYRLKINDNSYIIRSVMPCHLPIKLQKTNNIFYGSVEEITPRHDSSVFFGNIVLHKTTTEITSTVYVHELGHTQIDSVKGSVVHYYNDEVISIFLSMLHAYSLDKDETLLTIDDARRIRRMNIRANYLRKKDNMSKDDILESSKYLNSDLIATNLFITYYYGSFQIKKEMLGFIQEVFDGNKTVEDLITKYDSSYEEAQDLKRLIKYYGR